MLLKLLRIICDYEIICDLTSNFRSVNVTYIPLYLQQYEYNAENLFTYYINFSSITNRYGCIFL